MGAETLNNYFCQLAQVCQDFSVRGYWAILQAPKYLVNAIFVHLVARGLRWHIDRMLGRSFLQEDEVGSPQPRGEESDGTKEGVRASGVIGARASRCGLTLAPTLQ